MDFNDCASECCGLKNKKIQKAENNLEDLFDKFMSDEGEAELASSYLWNAGY